MRMLEESATPCQRQPELFDAPDAGELWPGVELKETSQRRRERERAAVQLCWECPAWRRCREWAIRAEDQVVTVCGGLTPAQLRVERRRAA